jgi:hypothetical protein
MDGPYTVRVAADASAAVANDGASAEDRHHDADAANDDFFDPARFRLTPAGEVETEGRIANGSAAPGSPRNVVYTQP